MGGFWTPELVFIGLVLLVYLSFNLALNYYDNWIITRPPNGLGFPAPLFYSACHMLACFVIASLLIWTLDASQEFPNRPSFMQFWNKKILLALNSALFCASIISNHYINDAETGPGVNQVLRAIVPLPLLVLSYYAERKRYSVPKISLVLLIVFAAIIAVPFHSLHSKILGFCLSVASTVCFAGKASLSALLLSEARQTGLTPLVLVWYDAMLSTIVLIFACLLAGETYALNQYRTDAILTVVFGMIGGSVAAYPYNFVCYKLIQLTSSLTFGLATTLKYFLVVVFPMIILDHTQWIGAYVGAAIFLCAIFLYCALEQKYESVWLSWVGKWTDYYAGIRAPIGGASPSDKKKKTEKTPLNEGEEEEADPSRPKGQHSWWAA